MADLVLKSDFLNLSQSSLLTQLTNSGGTTCGTPTQGGGDVGLQRGSTSLTTYLIGGDLTDRIPHGENSWIGPTGGFRYTNTVFGSDTSITVFRNVGTQIGTMGLEDGQALRLQGGVRFGQTWTSTGGVRWQTEFAALAYSDVWVDGFNFTSTNGGTVSPVDQGKVRGLGEARAKIDMGSGLSYIVQGDVYGGQDLIGVAGQMGIRYEF